MPLMLMSMSGYGFGQRHDVRDLGGQVEDDVLPRDEPPHDRLVPHVGDSRSRPGSDLGDVGEIAPVAFDHRVAEGDARALVTSRVAEVGADEAEASGDQDALAGEAHAETAPTAAGRRRTRRARTATTRVSRLAAAPST